MSIHVIEFFDFSEDKLDVDGNSGPTRFRKLCPVQVTATVAEDIAARAEPASVIWPTWSSRVKIPRLQDHELFDRESRQALEAEPNRGIIVE